MFEAMLKLVCRSYVQILAALYFLSFFWEGAQTMRKSMKHAHLDGIQRTKTLVQDKYGWYKPTAQRQQKIVLSKDIEAQNAKTIEKTKKKQNYFTSSDPHHDIYTLLYKCHGEVNTFPCAHKRLPQVIFSAQN